MKHARFAILSVVLFILSFATAVSAEISRGTVQENLTVESKILGHQVKYSIYLPYDYETSNRSYPIVYLLHGLGDDNNAWVQFGEINLIADKAISNQEIAPMIIVTPDAGRSWYVNSADGTCLYEDFFFKEFIPAIESSYRVRGERRYRGIAGLSMGGYGTLLYSMKHPDMFVACAAFSAGIHTDDDVATMPDVGWSSWNSFYAAPFGERDMEGMTRLTKTWHENSILEIAKTYDKDKLCSVRYYMDCGDDDFLYRGNALLHIELCDRGIPHECRMRNGGHQWSYWRSGIKDGLAFISESFHQN